MIDSSLLPPAATGTAASLAFWLLVDPFDSFANAHTADLAERMSQLEFDLSRKAAWLRVWGLGIVAVVVLVGHYAGMPPLALVFGYIAYRMCRIFLQFRIKAREAVLRDQLAKAAMALAGSVRSGETLPRAIAFVNRETLFPLKAVLGRVVRDVAGGRPDADAVRAARDRLKLDQFSVFCAVLLTELQRGGESSGPLTRLAHSLREQQRLERKLRSETASGRLVVWTLVGFPPAFLILFLVIFREGTILLFRESSGQAVLALVTALTYTSWRWATSILNIKA